MEETNIHAPMHVALYARVSTDEQKQGETINSQVAELEAFCRQQAWHMVDLYKDEGYSGALLARPELDRLRDDAQKGIFAAVLINDVDRLARDVSHLGVIKRDLERKGIQVIFRKLPSQTSPTHNLMVNILGSFAEFEREMIADRMRRGMRHRVEVKRLVLTSHAPYGYRYVPKDEHAGTSGGLAVVPEEAAVVRQMFRWVERDGLSAQAVRRRLNERRIAPRNGGHEWAKSSVIRILRAEVYAGVWYYGKHQGFEPTAKLGAVPRYRKSTKTAKRRRPKADWIAVPLPDELRFISRPTWERVQKQLDDNRAFSPRNAKRLYLLSGLMRCGGCGAPFGGQPCHGKLYYRCSKRCKRVGTIKAEIINEVVWQAVERVLRHPAAVYRGLSALGKTRAAKKSAAPIELAEIEQGLRQLAAEEARVLEAYRLAVISPEHLGQELGKLTIRKQALLVRKTQLAVTETTITPDADIKGDIERYCRIVRERLNLFTDEQRQRFLRQLQLRIRFTGTAVYLAGKLPIDRDLTQNQDPAGTVPPPGGGDVIANTSTERRGHNAASGGGIATTTVNRGVRNRYTIGPNLDLLDDRRLSQERNVPFEASAQLPPPVIIAPVNSSGKYCRRDDPSIQGTRTWTMPRRAP